MPPSVKSPDSAKSNWIYASLTVLDGDRQLKPSHFGFDRLRFRVPPHLTSGHIEIILVNGDQEQRHSAIVLPHDPEATRIPIQLVTPLSLDVIPPFG
jgi:hypothetical protein